MKEYLLPCVIASCLLVSTAYGVTYKYVDLDYELALTPDEIETRSYWLETYTDDGKLVKSELKNYDGPPFDFTAAKKIEYSYDKKGRMVERRFHPRITEEAYARPFSKEEMGGAATLEKLHDLRFVEVEKCFYDNTGNKTSVKFFTSAFEPTAREDNVHEIRYTYDNKGRLTEVSYFAEDAAPTVDIYGVHKIIYTYNDDNLLASKAFFAVQGEPVDANPREKWCNLKYFSSISGYPAPDKTVERHLSRYYYNDSGILYLIADFGKDGSSVGTRFD